MKHYSFEFIQECERGGKQAQKKLFETLYAPMFRVCLRYVNQNADAEDCLMRGFLKRICQPFALKENIVCSFGSEE